MSNTVGAPTFSSAERAAMQAAANARPACPGNGAEFNAAPGSAMGTCRGFHFPEEGSTIVHDPGYATTVIGPNRAIGCRPNPEAPGGVEVNQIYLDGREGTQHHLTASAEETQTLVDALKRNPPPAGAPHLRAEYDTTLRQLNVALTAKRTDEAELHRMARGDAPTAPAPAAAPRDEASARPQVTRGATFQASQVAFSKSRTTPTR